MRNNSLAIAITAVVSVGLLSSCHRAVKGPTPTTGFAGFPIGVERTFSIEGVNSLLQGLSWRERREQMRDWLMYTVVSSAGRTPQQISHIMYNVPPVRASYLQSVASFPTGSMRTAYLGSGEAIALVPRERDSDRLEDLALAADEHRKNLGKSVVWLHVFEYTFGARGGAMTVRRLNPVQAATLYTAAAGYHETVIRSSQDLKSFLSEINDVTFVSPAGQALRLGGRKLGTAAGIDLSEVAEIYRSDRKYRVAQEDVEEITHRFNAEWGEIRYSTPEEKARLVAQRDAANKVAERNIAEIRNSVGPRPACGFSLDPTPEGAATYLYQKATYICDLQGTQTSMVLFYTDLLAKLWALDFQKGFPRNIPEFMPMTETKVSPLYRGEFERLSHTRIWFGPLHSGFQSTTLALLFSHTVTRVFALSRVGSELSHEVPPNAASAAFVDWWNGHYDEIASLEPQYQKLNQIMKWSLVCAWLEARNFSRAFAFLDHVPANRPEWFPDWVKGQHTLRFSAWDRVGFHPRGYAGVPTETMEILSSEPYKAIGHTWTLSGGVEMGSEADFRRRKALPDTLPDVDRHAGIDYSVEGYPDRLVTYEGGNYLFHGNETNATVTAVPPAGQGLRSPTAEFGDGTAVVGFQNLGRELNASVRVGEVDSLSLSFGERLNGFGVRRSKESSVQASSLLRALSENRSAKWELDLIVGQSGVLAAVRLPGGDFLAGFRGEQRWLHIQPETSSGPAVAAGQLRGAGAGEDSGVYRTAWLSPSESARLLSPYQAVQISRTQGTAEGIRIEVSARGPPAAGASEREGMVSLHRARNELPADALSTPQAAERLMPKSGLEEFAQYLRDGDEESAATDLARDPVALKQRIAEYRVRGLGLGLQELGDGDYTAAVRHLSPLAEIDPADSEVAIPLGIARLLTGNIGGAVADLEEVFGAAAKPFDDIIGRLPEADRTRLAGMGSYLRFSDFAGHHPELKLGGFPYESNGTVRFVAQLEALARPRTISTATALKAGSTLYAEDVVPPGTEWVPSSRTLDQLVRQDIHSAFQETDSMISRFSPDGIEYRRTRDHFSLVEKASAQQPPGDQAIHFVRARPESGK